MDCGIDDSYGVYVRAADAAFPDDGEELIASCSSYEDAVRVHRTSGHAHHSIIRYHGDVGGGD